MMTLRSLASKPSTSYTASANCIHSPNTQPAAGAGSAPNSVTPLRVTRDYASVEVHATVYTRHRFSDLAFELAKQPVTWPPSEQCKA